MTESLWPEAGGSQVSKIRTHLFLNLILSNIYTPSPAVMECTDPFLVSWCWRWRRPVFRLHEASCAQGSLRSWITEKVGAYLKLFMASQVHKGLQIYFFKHIVDGAKGLFLADLKNEMKNKSNLMKSHSFKLDFCLDFGTCPMSHVRRLMTIRNLTNVTI